MEAFVFVLYYSNMRSAAPAPAIRVYNLFGESGDLPDVVHCETIASRSVLHDWTLAVHRHARLHQVLLIDRGGGEATLDGRVVQLKPMQIVNVPVGHVHGFRFVPHTQGWVLTIAAEILDEALLASEGLRGALSRSAVIRGTPQIRTTMKQIFAEHAARDFGRAHVLRALSAAMIGLVARALTGEGGGNGTAESGLFRRFEALLEQHHLERWSVADYASALSITPTHLNRVTRAATGDTASHLILNRLIREARRNLVYTNLPVSTIAYALGFEDPAYFSRVYAAATGVSPRAFRAQLHGEET
ncbi:helix-turn-helix domain-containing protein [Bradyrhizobium sp. WSM1417]|uniref:helix-turn-helix domain-containing protein n=1 Tax=Bradyrhizobium sp. WSM1417 TaxID=754500 RepID=UPI000485854D|nr:helix-turn-helix domain-containing protein [Bradyrhizobium sp. WSM1417]